MPSSIGAEGSDGFRRHARPLLSPGKVIVATFTAGQQTTLPIWMLSELVRPRTVAGDQRGGRVRDRRVADPDTVRLLGHPRHRDGSWRRQMSGVRAARGRWIDGWPGEAHTVCCGGEAFWGVSANELTGWCCCPFC